MDNELRNGKKEMDEMHKDRSPIRERVYRSKFSIEEIKHYLEGLCLVGEHKANDMLNCAISLLEDHEDGIEAVLERKRQNDLAQPERQNKSETTGSATHDRNDAMMCRCFQCDSCLAENRVDKNTYPKFCNQCGIRFNELTF